MNKPTVRTIRFIAAEKKAEELAAVSFPVAFPDAQPDETDLANLARGYLNRVLDLNVQATGLSFATGDEPMPTFDVSKVQRSKLTRSSLVRFAQTQGSIPIFGSDLVVEIDESGKLVGVQADVAKLEDASTEPNLDASAAIAQVAALLGVDPGSLTLAVAPTLTFYRDEEEGAEGARWHLAWLIRDVPRAPPASSESHGRFAHRPSPRTRSARHDYLVDAHDGAILLHYSTMPCVRAGSPGLPAIPVRCRGVDALGHLQEFYGTAVKGGFELSDPQRKLRTFDLEMGDISGIDIPMPSQPIHHEQADFSRVNPEAISAHVNVARVWDFYNAILQRDSVDDKGMELVSIVNCTSKEDADPDGDPREWGNAIWWDQKMWYGQVQDKKGGLLTFANCLDIIGHELTHGVTENSSGLIYQGQSGALNESFSDIMGMLIVNWYKSGPDSPVSSWTWEFAPGCGENGAPLRDLSDPRRTGDPAHMKNFLRTREDDGGVHSNSNIHNKAAYNVLTAIDSKGKPVFTPREVAILYYSTLVRLPSRATFSRTLRVLLDVATTFYAVDTEERDRKLRAIEGAYRKVGIEPDPG